MLRSDLVRLIALYLYYEMKPVCQLCEEVGLVVVADSFEVIGDVEP